MSDGRMGGRPTNEPAHGRGRCGVTPTQSGELLILCAGNRVKKKKKEKMVAGRREAGSMPNMHAAHACHNAPLA